MFFNKFIKYFIYGHLEVFFLIKIKFSKYNELIWEIWELKFLAHPIIQKRDKREEKLISIFDSLKIFFRT